MVATRNLPYSPDFGNPEKFSKDLFELLRRKKKKIFVVENSTGGFISSFIVKQKGASQVFEGGIFPYSHRMKKRFGADIKEFGAVSEKCVLSLAEKWMEESGADICVSESSILGPTGGTQEKPVGLSFTAVVSKKGRYTYVNLFRGSRNTIMHKVAAFSFFAVINHIIGWELEKREVSSTFLEYEGKILVMRRSGKVGSYRGMWGVASGHVEEGETPVETAIKEVKEETGVSTEKIKELISSSPFELSDAKLGIRWEINPFRAVLREKPKVKIDWEHTEFKWIPPKKIVELKTAPLLYQGYLKTIFSPKSEPFGDIKGGIKHF